MKNRSILFLLILFALETQATIRYVRPTSHGSGNGSSCANASNDLQLMINNSAAGDSVFVAEGTYIPKYTADGYNAATNTYPYTDGGRDNSFVLKADVKIFGGFPDNEMATWLDRDWNTNFTILNGDRGISNNNTDNCHHIVISSGYVGTACLDGFTITEGNANGGSNMYVNGNLMTRWYGGGISCIVSSPLLKNLVINNNRAIVGGGICNNQSSPELTNVTISENYADNGGGIYSRSSSFVLTNIIIQKNYASAGGGIFNVASPIKLINVIITENHAGQTGGGFYNVNNSFIELTNVLIIKNQANERGGGIYNYCEDGFYASFILTNVTITKNYATNSGGGIAIDINNFSSAIHNSIIWGNTTSRNIKNNIEDAGSIIYQNCLVGGEHVGNGIILNGDPLFMDTANDNYRLMPYSPAINAGNNACYNVGATPDLSAIITDLDGNSRIYNGIVDLGAYEYPLCITDTTTCFASFCQGDTYTDHNFSNLTQAGTYSNTLQNTNGCDSVIELTLTVNPTTKIESIIANSPLLCEGGELQIEVQTIGKNLVYQWYKDNNLLQGETNKNFTVSSVTQSHNGTYNIEVRGVCGNATSQKISIDANGDNILVEKWHDVILVDNSSRQFVGYQWYKNNVILNGATEQFYQEIGGLNGCYSVELTLTNGGRMRSCERCAYKTVKSNEIHIYPNPTSNQLRITNYELRNDAEIQIYDVVGRLLQSKIVNLQSEIILDISHLANGIYFLKIDGKTTKIIKQ